MSFFELFQPGLRHLREERDRQKMLVSKPTPGGGAPLGIDLDAGVAKITITRPAPAAPDAVSDAARTGDPATDDPVTGDPATDDLATADPATADPATANPLIADLPEADADGAGGR